MPCLKSKSEWLQVLHVISKKKERQKEGKKKTKGEKERSRSILEYTTLDFLHCQDVENLMVGLLKGVHSCE